MENSRLVQLLRSFSPEDLRDFKKFVRSPFFNQRTEVVNLLDWLEKPLKNGQPVPGKPEAFEAVFGNRNFDDHRIRMSMSFLFQAACQFLATNDFLHDQSQFQLRLATQLRERKLSDLARQARQAGEKKLQQQHQRNADFHLQQYQFILENYRAELENSQMGTLPLQALSDQLDRSFLSRKLWQSCFMRSHQTVYGSQFDFGLLDAGIQHLEHMPVLQDPATMVYYHCYAALNTPDEKSHFQNFKKRLLEHSELFPGEELRDLYVLAINFCIRQYNAGNKEYLPEQFDFYREGFDKAYFLVEGNLSHYTYQNAATVGLVLQQLEWVDQFIHRYRETCRNSIAKVYSVSIWPGLNTSAIN